MDIIETLNTIKTLTGQQLALANKIMALKRQLAGKSANSVYNAGENTPTPTSTPKATAESISNEPKRGRGRPKKNTSVTSFISQIQGQGQCPGEFVTESIDEKKKMPISIYGYGYNNTDTGRLKMNLNLKLNPIYVIENDDLYIRDDNGMLYDIESRDVIGWYNPYESGCNINWLYR